MENDVNGSIHREVLQHTRKLFCLNLYSQYVVYCGHIVCVDLLLVLQNNSDSSTGHLVWGVYLRYCLWVIVWLSQEINEA